MRYLLAGRGALVVVTGEGCGSQAPASDRRKSDSSEETECGLEDQGKGNQQQRYWGGTMREILHCGIRKEETYSERGSLNLGHQQSPGDPLTRPPPVAGKDSP